MFRMMMAVPRVANVRQATIKSQTVRSVKHKARHPPSPHSALSRSFGSMAWLTLISNQSFHTKKEVALIVLRNALLPDYLYSITACSAKLLKTYSTGRF